MTTKIHMCEETPRQEWNKVQIPPKYYILFSCLQFQNYIVLSLTGTLFVCYVFFLNQFHNFYIVFKKASRVSSTFQDSRKHHLKKLDSCVQMLQYILK